MASDEHALLYRFQGVAADSTCGVCPPCYQIQRARVEGRADFRRRRLCDEDVIIIMTCVHRIWSEPDVAHGRYLSRFAGLPADVLRELLATVCVSSNNARAIADAMLVTHPH